MEKEPKSIPELKEREVKLSGIIDQRQKLYETIGEKIPGADRTKIVQIGRVRFKLDLSKQKFQTRLALVSEQLDEQLIQPAQKYLDELAIRAEERKDVETYINLGHLPASVLSKLEEEDAVFTRKPEEDPNLKRGIELVKARQEQQKQKNGQVEPAPEDKKTDGGQVLEKTEQEKQEIWTRKMTAIKLLIDNPNIAVEEAIKLLGTNKKGQPFIKNRALWALTGFVSMLYTKVRLNKASIDELELWDKIRQETKQQDNKTAMQSLGKILKDRFYPESQKEPEKNEDEGRDYSQIKNHPEMVKFLDRLPQPARILIEKFLDSKQGSLIMEQIKKFRTQNGIDNKDFTLSLVGSIFEQLSYRHLSNQYAERSGLIVLSPQEVLELYKKIFPDRIVSNYFNLNYGIEGITYPDGLILRETENALMVDAVVEYKMWVNQIAENFQRQLQNYRYGSFVNDFFQGGISDQSFYSEVLNLIRPGTPIKPIIVNPNLKIIYGLPENSYIELPSDVIGERIPINSSMFKVFIDSLMEIVRKEEAVVLRQEVDQIMDTSKEIQTITQPAEISFPDGQDTRGFSEIELKILEGLLITSEENPADEEELAEFVGLSIPRLRLAMPSLRAKSATRNWTVDTKSQIGEDKKTFVFLTKMPEETDNGSGVDYGSTRK